MGLAELDWLVPEHLDDYAIPRLNSTGVKRTARLDVAKENFAIRPAVVLDPLDRLLYRGEPCGLRQHKTDRRPASMGLWMATLARGSVISSLREKRRAVGRIS